MADRGQTRRAAPLWLVAGVLLVLASFPYFDGLLNANERPRLLQGMALVQQGQWQIDAWATPSSKWRPGPDVARGPADTGGHLYPNKPPGASLVAAAAYIVDRGLGGDTMRGYVWWARLFGAVIPTVLIVVVAWRRYASRYGEAPTLAALAIYVLATPVASYAKLLFGHQLAAALLFVGVVWIDDATREPGASTWRAVLGGVLAASAVGVEYTAVFAGIPIAVFLAWRARESRVRRGVAAAVAGAFIPIVALALYHDHAFGSPWTTPYHHVTDAGFAEIHHQGLLGLTVPTATSIFEHLLSPWGGLLWWCPVAGVAFVALARMRSSAGDSDTRLALAIFAVLLAVNLGLSQAGGWRVGPRYLVVGLPFIIPGLAAACREAGEQPSWFASVVGLAGWSTFVNGLAASLFPHLVPIGNPVRQQLIPLWLSGHATYGWMWSLGLGAAGPTVVLVASLAAIFAAARRAAPTHGVRVWVAASAIAAAVAWVTWLQPDDPAASESLEAIERIWEPPGGEAKPL